MCVAVSARAAVPGVRADAGKFAFFLGKILRRVFTASAVFDSGRFFVVSGVVFFHTTKKGDKIVFDFVPFCNCAVYYCICRACLFYMGTV